MNRKTKILTSVAELYQIYGIKSITMNDVAASLGISKKTLYEIFRNKGELVELVINYQMKKYANTFKKVNAEEKFNAIELFFYIGKHVMTSWASLSDGFLFDLQKYYPHILKKYLRRKRDKAYYFIAQNVNQGKAEGLYLKEVEASYISKFFISLTESMFEDDFFGLSTYDNYETFCRIFEYHIGAISTIKGREILSKMKPVLENFKKGERL